MAQWEAEYRMDVNGEGLSADDADGGNIGKSPSGNPNGPLFDPASAVFRPLA